MRIDLRNLQRERIGRLELAPEERPTKTQPADSDRGVILNWDSAVDDGGRLRRCVGCGCRDLFREKSFPAAAVVIILLAFIGAVVGLLGLATSTPAQIGLVMILAIDLALLLFSKMRLVCYQCRTSYHDLEIARYHRRWDRALAQEHPAPAPGIPLPGKQDSSGTSDSEAGGSGSRIPDSRNLTPPRAEEQKQEQGA